MQATIIEFVFRTSCFEQPWTHHISRSNQIFCRTWTGFPLCFSGELAHQMENSKAKYVFTQKEFFPSVVKACEIYGNIHVSCFLSHIELQGDDTGLVFCLTFATACLVMGTQHRAVTKSLRQFSISSIHWHGVVFLDTMESIADHVAPGRHDLGRHAGGRRLRVAAHARRHRPRERRRHPALLVGHNRATQGGHADPSKPGRARGHHQVRAQCCIAATMSVTGSKTAAE